MNPYIYRRHSAVARLRNAFGAERVHDNSAYRGLGRAYTRSMLRQLESTVHRPEVPFGWRVWRDHNRDVRVILPFWLWLLLEGWTRRYEFVYRPLRRLGLWKLDSEGAYWWDGRFTLPRPIARAVWCFLNDADKYEPWLAGLRRPLPRVPHRLGPMPEEMWSGGVNTAGAVFSLASFRRMKQRLLDG